MQHGFAAFKESRLWVVVQFEKLILLRGALFALPRWPSSRDLFDNLNRGIVFGSEARRALSRIIPHEPRHVALANLHRPHWQLPLEFDYLGCSGVFHGVSVSDARGA